MKNLARAHRAAKGPPPDPESVRAAAAALSALGASKGGKARSASLSCAKRKAIAQEGGVGPLAEKIGAGIS